MAKRTDSRTNFGTSVSSNRKRFRIVRSRVTVIMSYKDAQSAAMDLLLYWCSTVV